MLLDADVGNSFVTPDILLTEGYDQPYPLFLPTYAATAWYHKKRPTFSDTLAAVRRQVWCEQGFLASRRSSELAKLQPALRDGIVHALCHAA